MLRFPAKQIRAVMIRDWCAAADVRGVVAFSCGNNAAALKAAGLYVIDITAGGSLQSEKWWTQAEIKRAWPHLLDATSGHLPPGLLAEVAVAFKAHLGAIGRGPHRVPTGSGETIVCLSMAYPDELFFPVYDDRELATTYDARAPLSALVQVIKARAEACADVKA